MQEATRKTVSVRVWGEWALFTRPELKVERVSYSVITPSAARGVLQAIFWKPEMRYEIKRIGVVNQGTQVSVMRKERNSLQGRKPSKPDTTLRNSLMLKDVEYLIEADIVTRDRAEQPVYKFSDQFNRRARRGQCYFRPYLGTRECSAYFSPVERPDVDPDLNRNLGNMLFDVAFVPSEEKRELRFRVHDSDGSTNIESGYHRPLFFDAELEDGWIDVPQEKYEKFLELKRPSDA